MAKQKVTLSLDAAQVEELRDLVGARSLSAAVDSAVEEHLGRLRHLAAVDAWLAELDEEHGPVPPRVQSWAAGVVDRWEAGVGPLLEPGPQARTGEHG